MKAIHPRFVSFPFSSVVSVSHAVLVLGKGLAIYTEECLH